MTADLLIAFWIWASSVIGVFVRASVNTTEIRKRVQFPTEALALPSFNKEADYMILKEWIEKKYPKYEIVFIHQDEKLLNPGAERTPLTVYDLRVWMVRRSA